ncbi:hypothetical protein V6N11_040169 [Hibiscus sabdariffa]|uniref:RNase H type-1 domain-containing protein n=1 Tax=Hibiscus sabdariffa TaxID=183260 RepID=A0ABR2RGN9_9ROSI
MPLVSDEVTCGGKNGGAAREEGSPIVSLPPMSVLHTCMDLVNAPIMEEVVVEGLDLKSVGPVFEGSTTEIVNIHGSRRKVRLLSDVIQSVLSPEERELPAKYSSKKGRGRLLDWCKLNVDETQDHSSGFTACGGLIRDHNGRWVRDFAHLLGVCSSIKVELWAVHEGLVQAWALGLRRVVVEVDSTLVLCLLSQHPGMVLSMIIVQHLLTLLGRDWSVNLVHFFRETNVVADSLAQLL